MLLWENRYNGPGNFDDEASAVAVDKSGNVVVTGYSGDSGTNNYYTAKYAAASGALLWEKRGPGGGLLVMDGSGNVVVTGSSYNGTNYHFYSAKYAGTDGALLWEHYYRWSTNSDEFVTGVAVDGNGNVAVTGYTWTNADYYTAKYAAADGTLLWERRYNGPANGVDASSAVAVDKSGNVVVTGFSAGSNGYGDYYTAKYAAADGALLWEKRYDGPANRQDGASAVAVDASGNVVVTGASQKLFFDSDYYTAKYAAADGTLLWEQRYDARGNQEDLNKQDYAQAVAVDGSGNVVVRGSSGGCLDCDTGDYYTAKYAAADGTLLWEKRYNGPANRVDMVSFSGGLALGPNGIAITGSVDGWSAGGWKYDYGTVVYRENLPPVSIALVPAGIRLSFPGVAGLTYTIERAPAVTGPWNTITTPTAPLNAFIEYVDTNAPAGSAFYRTHQP